MANKSPDTRLGRQWENLNEANIPQADKEAIRTTIENLDDHTRDGTNPSENTQAVYCRCLRLVSKYADAPLTDMEPAALNATIAGMADDKGWSSDSTTSQYQSALTALADYRGFERDSIDVETTSRHGGKVDPRTVLSPGQFHDLREAAPTMRDRALIDLLGYTGQRVGLVKKLRVRDVKPEEGIWYVPDVKGLKGASKVLQKGSLLGAKKSAKEWKQMHPTGDSDHHFITALSHGPNGDVGGEISSQTIRRRLRKTAERAGIDPDETPVNPHAFRHFFVTVCKTQYDMDDGYVKKLIGHRPESKVMETTYQHLSDEDAIKAAEESWGMRDEADDPDAFAPPTCPVCATPLRPDTEACPTPNCKQVFSPGAEPTGGSAVSREEVVPDDAVVMNVDQLNRVAAEMGAAMSKPVTEGTDAEPLDSEEALKIAEEQDIGGRIKDALDNAD